jgi:beta-D-xylosidase 4
MTPAAAGEDPFLTSTYAIHFIKGVQGVDPSGRGYLRAAATPKHYAGYNFDSWHGMDRYHYNALISKQDWADTYSQPFQASVVGANASGDWRLSSIFHPHDDCTVIPNSRDRD